MRPTRIFIKDENQYIITSENVGFIKITNNYVSVNRVNSEWVKMFCAANEIQHMTSCGISQLTAQI